jgi:hypothetical protein
LNSLENARRVFAPLSTVPPPEPRLTLLSASDMTDFSL